MVTAIINGERDPDKLILFKNSRIKASDEVIKKSLRGIWKDEYLFLLEQAYNEYMFYQSQLKECEEKIKGALLNMAAKLNDGDVTGLVDDKKKLKTKKNQFSFKAQPILKAILGVDICKVDGIGEVSALELISETGINMKKWKNSKHFSAWLNVAPNTKITGGKIISSKIEKKKNKAGQTLRMACCSMVHNKGPMGDYAKKMRARLGKKGGVTATAHKLSRIIYTMIRDQKEYDKTLLCSEAV